MSIEYISNPMRLGLAFKVRTQKKQQDVLLLLFLSFFV